MYFVKRITIDEKSCYQTSAVIAHTNKQISTALTLLENTVRDFVREERGREAAEQAKFIDIHNIEQVNEPLIDCCLLYRLENDPHKIHVYQKKTVMSKTTNWAWTPVEVPVTQFYKTDIFELEHYDKLIMAETPIVTRKADENRTIPLPPPDLRQNIKTANTESNTPPTVGTVDDLVTALKQSNQFKKFLDLANTSKPESAPQHAVEKYDDV